MQRNSENHKKLYITRQSGCAGLLDLRYSHIRSKVHFGFTDGEPVKPKRTLDLICPDLKVDRH